jgi:acyl dehydratase
VSAESPKASRVFGVDDQIRFARLSGDFNPIHVDPVAARRTLSGELAVHGVHGLLWALETLAPTLSAMGPIRQISADFDEFVHPGDWVTIALGERTETSFTAELRVGEIVATRITVCRTVEAPIVGSFSTAIGDVIGTGIAEARQPELSSISSIAGQLALTPDSADAARNFPAVTSLLGADVVQAIASATRLVGMVCPGLHSIFSALSLELTDRPAGGQTLAFKVIGYDSRFRIVRLAVSSGRINGLIKCYVRPAPVTQPAFAELEAVIRPGEFDGARVLVIGGSRGLGELCAKAIAAGGGQPIITFATGRADAEGVADEIKAAGRHCDIVRLDVTQSVAQQVGEMPVIPSHVYYFATPRISRRRSGIFSSELFNEFIRIYVDAFYELCSARYWSKRVVMFYPSSVFVAERPRGMAEYAMAKAAGEVLCQDVNRFFRNVDVVVERLPRLSTDQTASTAPTRFPPAIDVMLPIIRRIQSSVAATPHLTESRRE